MMRNDNKFKIPKINIHLYMDNFNIRNVSYNNRYR